MSIEDERDITDEWNVTDETDLGVTSFSSSTLRRADIVYVIDCTGTMEIDGEDGIPLLSAIKKCLYELLRFYDDKDIDIKIGLTEFRDQKHTVDRNYGRELMKYHEWNGSRLTSNRLSFKESLDGLEAKGGGPLKESILDALVTTAEFTDWTEGASRIIILFTDTEPHERDIVVRSKSEAIKRLQKAGINQLHLCINESKFTEQYGDFFNIKDLASNNEITEIHDIITRDFDEMTRVLKNVHKGSVKRAEAAIKGSRYVTPRRQQGMSKRKHAPKKK
jgi:hypothetical protein